MVGSKTWLSVNNRTGYRFFQVRQNFLYVLFSSVLSSLVHPVNTYWMQAVSQPWWQTLEIIIPEGSLPRPGDHLVNEWQVVPRKMWKDGAMRIKRGWCSCSQAASSLLSSCCVPNQWRHYPSAKTQQRSANTRRGLMALCPTQGMETLFERYQETPWIFTWNQIWTSGRFFLLWCKTKESGRILEGTWGRNRVGVGGPRSSSTDGKAGWGLTGELLNDRGELRSKVFLKTRITHWENEVLVIPFSEVEGNGRRLGSLHSRQDSAWFLSIQSMTCLDLEAQV